MVVADYQIKNTRIIFRDDAFVNNEEAKKILKSIERNAYAALLRKARKEEA